MAKTLREWGSMSPEERKAAGFKQAPKLYKYSLYLLGALALMIMFGILMPDSEAEIARQAEQARQDSIQAALDALPHNSEWDGSVQQVEAWLRANLNDWDSYESLEWYQVISRPDGTFFVKHRFRAANALGVQVVQNIRFTLDSAGTVIDVQKK